VADERFGSRLAAAAGAFASKARNPSVRRAQLAFLEAWTAESAGFTVALGIVAYRDGGATAVGLVGLLRMVPSAVVAPLAAPLAERGRGNGCWSRVSTVRGRRDNPGRVEQLGGNFDVIIDGIGGATLGLAVEHVAPRGVVVNIATQPGDETVSFRAKCFDRARGAAIYTLNLPDELASHASAASDLTAPSRPAVPASPAPHPAAHRTCCRTAHPQIPQRRRLDSSMVAPASRPPINPPDGSAGPAAPKPPKICPD
jgi:hypothetical protein